MASEEKYYNENKVYACISCAIVFLVLSLILFGAFVNKYSSKNLEVIAKSVIYQWAALIAILFSIVFVGFAILFKIAPDWREEEEKEEATED